MAGEGSLPFGCENRQGSLLQRRRRSERQGAVQDMMILMKPRHAACHVPKASCVPCAVCPLQSLHSFENTCTKTFKHFDESPPGGPHMQPLLYPSGLAETRTVGTSKHLHDHWTKVARKWSLWALRIICPSGRVPLPRNLVRLYLGWGTKMATKQVSGAKCPQIFDHSLLNIWQIFRRSRIRLRRTCSLQHASVPFSR
jgi:hypothetical protein